MGKISSQINVKQEEGQMNESEFTALMTNAFLLARQIIGMLLISIERGDSVGVFSIAKMKQLVYGLEENFPYMTEDELTFMVDAIHHCFGARIGLNLMAARHDAGYTESGLHLTGVVDLIIQRGLLGQASGPRIEELLNVEKKRQ